MIYAAFEYIVPITALVIPIAFVTFVSLALGQRYVTSERRFLAAAGYALTGIAVIGLVMVALIFVLLLSWPFFAIFKDWLP